MVIIWAAQCGRLEVVRLLIADPRVDPSAQNNKAIILAAGNGHLEVVNRLLLDSRVDPSDDSNCAIQLAAEPLDTTTCAGLLTALNRHPLLKEKYTSIDSEGNLETNSKQINWLEL